MKMKKNWIIGLVIAIVAVVGMYSFYTSGNIVGAWHSPEEILGSATRAEMYHEYKADGTVDMWTYNELEESWNLQTGTYTISGFPIIGYTLDVTSMVDTDGDGIPDTEMTMSEKVSFTNFGNNMKLEIHETILGFDIDFTFYFDKVAEIPSEVME